MLGSQRVASLRDLGSAEPVAKHFGSAASRELRRSARLNRRPGCTRKTASVGMTKSSSSDWPAQRPPRREAGTWPAGRRLGLRAAQATGRSRSSRRLAAANLGPGPRIDETGRTMRYAISFGGVDGGLTTDVSYLEAGIDQCRWCCRRDGAQAPGRDGSGWPSGTCRGAERQPRDRDADATRAESACCGHLEAAGGRRPVRQEGKGPLPGVLVAPRRW